jgi:ribosomal protein RSM22 (predicted rRNA methylase)
VSKARNILMKEGFFMQSPCPHNQPCPLAAGGKTGKDWCHFSARLSRTVLHRYAKKGSLMWENEPFSYIVMTRTKAPESKPRVLKHPRQRKGQVILDLCTPEGTHTTSIVTKKNPTLYAHAQNIKWGAPFPSQEER